MTLSLLLSGCNTTVMSEREGTLAALDLTGYPTNVYVGISGPYSTQERMVQEAIMAAARSIHLSHALALDSRLVTSAGSGDGLRSFATKEGAFWDDTSLAQTIEALKPIAVFFERDAGAIVVVEDPREMADQRVYRSEYGPDGKPLWLRTLPRIPGYRFGVGSALRYSLLNRSLEAADFASAHNLLDLHAEHVFSIEKVSTYNDVMERVLYQAQRGLLRGFTIVDRYYDADTKTYWSLASCYE